MEHKTYNRHRLKKKLYNKDDYLRYFEQRIRDLVRMEVQDAFQLIFYSQPM